MARRWQKVERRDRVIEYFWIGDFLQSHTWEDSSPPSVICNFDYSKDEDYFDISFSLKVEFTEVIHVTTSQRVLPILSNKGFRAGTKPIPGLPISRFVWFGININENDVISITEDFGEALLEENPWLEDKPWLTEKIASSPPFQSVSRYGNFKFTISLRDILDEYKDQVCGNQQEPELRQMGTFAYRKELMHAVLVCPPRTPGLEKCPLLSHRENQRSVLQQTSRGTFVWRPHSTVDGGRRWEHVAFALYVPHGDYIFVKNLSDRLSLCPGVDMFKCGEFRDTSDEIESLISCIHSFSDTAHKKKFFFRILLRMIRAYLAEEVRYLRRGILPKTMKLNPALLPFVEQYAR